MQVTKCLVYMMNWTSLKPPYIHWRLLTTSMTFWSQNWTCRISHDRGDWWGCKLIVLYLFHILQGNIMWTSTARTTRDNDHAPLCCSAYCCNQVCSWVRYIATPICYYGNTFYWRRQTSSHLKITRSLIDQKIQKDSGLKEKNSK